MTRPQPASPARLSRRRSPLRSPIQRMVGAAGACLLTLVAGCAQWQLPPPDAPSARLPESQPAQAAAALTAEQQQDLTRLNKRIYDEQERTIERERLQRAIDDAMRSYASNAYFYSGWGGPGWYGPGWYGPGGYGPGWYGPRTTVGVGFGF
ncbi:MULTISPECIES: hypothetical protein [unclassified Pandoraea]|uniref:hypothetical protein n=1 Tax=unclassified Pandoraea TaxID=2624094 RepID=UPI001124F1FF|nr:MULTISPECIES: hypothetical protein [unclassified Pandoraea]